MRARRSATSCCRTGATGPREVVLRQAWNFTRTRSTPHCGSSGPHRSRISRRRIGMGKTIERVGDPSDSIDDASALVAVSRHPRPGLAARRETLDSFSPGRASTSVEIGLLARHRGGGRRGSTRRSGEGRCHSSPSTRPIPPAGQPRRSGADASLAHSPPSPASSPYRSHTVHAARDDLSCPADPLDPDLTGGQIWTPPGPEVRRDWPCPDPVSTRNPILQPGTAGIPDRGDRQADRRIPRLTMGGDVGACLSGLRTQLGSDQDE